MLDLLILILVFLLGVALGFGLAINFILKDAHIT